MITKINGVVISSGFGAMESFRTMPHTGIDIPLNEGTPLHAVLDGVVTKVYDGSTQIGKGVAMQTEDGTTHIFGHMSQVTVKPGEHLHAGDIIGASGNTGFSTGPHLHFATRLPDGTFKDPTPFADDITANIANSGNPSVFKEHLNNIIGIFKGNGAVDKYQQADNHYFLNWLWDKTQDGCIYIGEAFINHLPDIMGYSTILAGACIIIGSMVGKGGMMKPLAIYGGALIVAICLLIG